MISLSRLEGTNPFSRASVAFNEKQSASARYSALVSNCEKEPFGCLRIYRRRETIESFFAAGKQHADGTRSRVWNTDTLRGRLFVQFISLCYYEYLTEAEQRAFFLEMKERDVMCGPKKKEAGSDDARHRDRDSGQCKTLAWDRSRFLVLPSCL
jgi:transposase